MSRALLFIFFIILFAFHANATDDMTIDSVFNKIEQWGRENPTLHYKIVTTQASATNTDIVYQATSQNQNTITAISRTSSFPVTYTHQIRSLSNGSIVAIFPNTQRKVYIATKQEIDNLAYSFAGNVSTLASGIRSVSTNITHENIPNGHKLICTLDMGKLESVNLAEPMASQITIVIEIEQSGKITKTRLLQIGSAETISTFTYFSTPVSTILSYINSLPNIDIASISDDITYSEALIDELNSK